MRSHGSLLELFGIFIFFPKIIIMFCSYIFSRFVFSHFIFYILSVVSNHNMGRCLPVLRRRSQSTDKSTDTSTDTTDKSTDKSTHKSTHKSIDSSRHEVGDSLEKNMRMMSACIREIQVPVSDLCGLKNIMADIPEKSSIYHYAKCMNTCGILLSDMIENMRLYYTLSSGLYETEKSLFALRTELEVAFESLTNEHLVKFADDALNLNCSDIEVSLKFGKDVPNGLVESDSTCVLKIFQSLVENALRFTLEGTVNVEVYMESINQTRRRATLHMKVIDSGVGVPEKAREAIFEPLTKSHTESIPGGVGMGLAVARAMCEILGGSLRLETNSPESAGSTFHACFPLPMRGWSSGGFGIKKKIFHRGTVAEGRNRSFSDSIVSKWDNDEPREMPKILLVEDVKLNRTIVSRMMRDVNVVPHVAEDGVEAVEACRREKFDLILMDISMPNMGGIEASEEIKKNCPLNKQTPIVALTGTLAGRMEDACQQAGMIQCIAKPIRKKQLVQSVAANVKRKHKVWMVAT